MNMRPFTWILIIAACTLVFTGITGDTRLAGAALQQAPATSAMSQQQVQAVLAEYCVTCHNQRQKTASLELDT